MRDGRTRAKRWICAVVVMAGMGGVWTVFGPGRQAGVSASGARQPVLVELFTSEGCSSCPPADAVLARLDATQSAEGAQAIVLSEHVTYWNRLGWRDPFSLEAMTERQKEYGERFGLDSVYTPQAVVDGAAELVGSDAQALSRAVTRAAAVPKAALAIKDARWSGGAVEFSVSAEGAKSGTVLVAALAEDSTQSSVVRGENAGRTLHHVAVVRAMEEMSAGAQDGRGLELKLPAGGAASGGALRLVVFLAERRSGHVLGVAERRLDR